MLTHTLTTKLGRITGTVSDNVVQYRGLPYACIPGRFKDPIGPLTTLGDFDATRWGPMAVQIPGCDKRFAMVLNHEFTPMPTGRGEMSEFECANLVIVTPYTSQHQSGQDGLSPELFPTIVWIHGGANKIGSANFMAYDMKNFVKHSVDVARKPVVMVSLNHRLGILGYFASEEVGATGNYALKDQAIGMRWVKENIKEFGGDPGNITFMGESAGASAGSIHLYSKTPLFNRAILLSGLAGLFPPRPIEAQQIVYQHACAKLGISNVHSTEHSSRILTIDASELSNVSSQVPISATCDGDIIPTTEWLLFENSDPIPDWCDSVAIGTCKDEWLVILQIMGTIQQFTDPLQSLRHRLSTILPAASITELLSVFHISESDPRDTTIQKLCILTAAYAFRFPAYQFARRWTRARKKAYFAQFTVASPLPGMSQGCAHHGVDAVFSFQNHNGEMPESGGYRELAREMATAWCEYAYGEDPWRRFEGEEGVVKVFDVGDNGGEKRLRELDPEEWDTWWLIDRLGLDRVWKVVNDFMQGPGEGNQE